MDKIKECIRSFKEHPATAGETYWQHLCFTFCLAGRFFYLGFVSVAHGLVPFLFCKTTSAHIEEISETFRCRTKKD